MKQKLSMILASTLLLGLMASCSSSDDGTSTNASNSGTAGSTGVTSSSEAPEGKDTLVFANFRDIRDPQPHLYAGEMWMQEMLYETLVSVEESGIEPCLAESWDISPDGLVYTFNIREGMVFSDGYVLDAYAIELNFDAIWDNIERHVWLASVEWIEGYEAVDEHTFVITLSAPYYPLLTELGVTRPFAMCSPNVMIDGTTKDGVTEYIGSGPYKMIDHKEDEYATYTVNELYWGEIPEIENIHMVVIPDNQTRVMALEKGEVDIIYGAEVLDVDTLYAYGDKDGFVALTSDPLSTRQIILNAENPILTDLNVRLALTHATDKEMISEGIFYGMEEPADFLYSPSAPYADVGLEPYAFDTDLAISLLEESGWMEGSDGIREKDGQRLALKILYDIDMVTGKIISEFLQSEYKKIGVELTLEGLERQTYFDALKAGSFDISFNIAWGSPYDPESSLAAMLGPVYGDYAAQLSLPNKTELDQAIRDVFITVDEGERQELYDFIFHTLHDSAIYIPLTYENNKALYADYVGNVTFKPSQYTVPFWDMYFN